MPWLYAGSRFLGGGRLPVPVPVLGAEVLTDGEFENWNSATNLTSWNETIAGTSTVNQESTVVHAGTYATRLDVDASGSNVSISQTGKCTLAQWYQATFYGKSNPAGKSVTSDTLPGPTFALAATYTQYIIIGRAAQTFFQLKRAAGLSASSSLYLDNVSCKAITLASMFSVRPYSTHTTTKAMATVVAGTRAGVVCNLDSATSPANFVIASHDGTTARLTKCVGGTYTELLAVTTAYSAGAYVEIRRILGTNDYELWYNDAQVGAAQTISDATIISNTLAGLFNTYSGNTLAAFSCIPSTVPSYAWATAGGAPTPVAAYLAKGNTSLAASYVNLANPGTNNAAPGTAPTFAAATGWAFVAGSSQYLTTGITVPGDQTYTLIVRFSDASGTGVILGARSTTNLNLMLYLDSGANTVGYWYNSQSSRTPYASSGVLALAGRQPYRDGVADGGLISASPYTNDRELWIGARNGLPSYFSGKIQAVAIYSTALTAPQVAAVSAAMAAL